MAKNNPTIHVAVAGWTTVALVAYLYNRHRSSSKKVSDPAFVKVTAAGQQHHPSALRNRIPILKALLKLLPDSDTTDGCALEIATGTGALLEVVAPAFPQLSFQPSEYVPAVAAAPSEQWSKHGKIGLRLGLDELANIDEHGCKVFSNCVPAVALDLLKPWPLIVAERPGSFHLILCSNTLHITPWECAIGLFRGSGQLVSRRGGLETGVLATVRYSPPPFTPYRSSPCLLSDRTHTRAAPCV